MIIFISVYNNHHYITAFINIIYLLKVWHLFWDIDHDSE
jgi:hypothetical protein